MNKLLLRTVLYIFTLSLFAQDDSWKIIVEEPQITSVNQQLASTFMLQVYHRLSLYSYHQMSIDERAHRAERLNDQREMQLYANLDQLILQRDNLLFSGGTSDNYEQIDKQIEEKRREIQEMERSDYQVIPEELPLEFPIYQQDMYLFPLLQDFDSNGYDGIIRGRFQGIGEDIHGVVYLLYRDREVTLLNARGNLAQLEEWLDVVEINFRESVLGRTWGAMEISCEPSDAAVFSGDELLGVGEVYLRDGVPGSLDLTIRRDGYSSITQTVELIPGEKIHLDFELEKQLASLVSISSEPQGADVYLGSQWMGYTPLELELPGENLSLLVSKEGYFQEYAASNDLDYEMNLVLRPISGSIEELLELKKKRFYRSAAMFTLSLAFPIIMQGIQENRGTLYQKYEEQYNNSGSLSDYEDADEAYESYLRSYYTYGAALGVSGSFFAFSLYRLADYIITSERAILED